MTGSECSRAETLALWRSAPCCWRSSWSPYVVLSSGSPYRVRLLFSDASGLVSGDQVMIGPSSVGSVQSISLTDNGQAAIVISLDGSAAPLYRGTVARIEENGLAGIASHYITLQPAPARGNAQIPSGGTIPQSDTYAEVSLDQIFNTLNAQTRQGLRNIIQGEATSIKGKALEANRTLITSTRCSRARATSPPRSTATSPPSTNCWCRERRRCSCSPRAASS